MHEEPSILVEIYQIGESKSFSSSKSSENQVSVFNAGFRLSKSVFGFVWEFKELNKEIFFTSPNLGFFI